MSNDKWSFLFIFVFTILIIISAIKIDKLENRLNRLEKTAILKNDYNGQIALPIKPDGSEYIPIIIKDENTKKLKKERGEIENWDKRTQWLDLSPLYKKR